MDRGILKDHAQKGKQHNRVVRAKNDHPCLKESVSWTEGFKGSCTKGQAARPSCKGEKDHPCLEESMSWTQGFKGSFAEGKCHNWVMVRAPMRGVG